MAYTPSRSAGRIPQNEWDAAKARAESEHETLTNIIRRLLREYAEKGTKK